MAGRHVRYAPAYRALRIAAIILIALLVIWPFAEARMVSVEQTAVSSDSLPAEIGQLRIVYISDIHATGFPFFSMNQMSGVVSKINALNPDIVLLGGDYAGDTEGAINFFLKLPSIHSNYGVYAVLGEHDRTSLDSGDIARLKAAMVSAGVTPLINTVSTVRVGQSSISVAGLDDVGTGLGRVTEVAKTVNQADYVILLCHNPQVIDDALLATDANGKIKWFDLGLFGHTHNGQMVDLLSAAGITGNNRRGWFTEDKIPMLVSNGIGTTGLPMRFFCSPTIHVITVKSET